MSAARHHQPERTPTNTTTALDNPTLLHRREARAPRRDVYAEVAYVWAASHRRLATDLERRAVRSPLTQGSRGVRGVLCCEDRRSPVPVSCRKPRETCGPLPTALGPPGRAK
jgi:hypothetical protein